MERLDKYKFLVLASVFLSSVILATQLVTPAGKKVHTVGQSVVHGTELGDMEIVSVVYDPNVKSYPDRGESPYGPHVNPVYGLVKQALAYLNPGNPDNPLSNVIQQGDTVVLKPNLASKSEFATDGCTRTPVLRPLVDLAVQAGAAKVIIAEGSAAPYPDSIVFGPDYSNITGLVQALQSTYPGVVIDYKDLNFDDFTWVDLGENSTFHEVYAPQQLYSKSKMRMDENSFYYAQDCNGYNPKGYKPGLYAVANTVFQADVFINVPKMKVHMITGVTLSLKNLIGITVSSTGNTTHEEDIKDIPHWNNSAPRPVDEVLTREDSFENDVVWRVMADLNKIVLYADENGMLHPVKQRKYLSVVDAVIGMEGPTMYNPPGVPRPTGVIIAGHNPVAVDTVCSRVMGFNYTVLNSLINIGEISNHPIGKADPAAICVVGASLNGQTFGEPYVPHQDYEDQRIVPYRIRLQHFDPPDVELIKTDPATPREGVETKVLVFAQNVDLVAAGWLRYSVDGTEPLIQEMVLSGETMIGNLDLLEGGTRASFEVCLQDYFFNTYWSDKVCIFVGSLEVFSIFSDEVEYHVTAIANSTIANFNFNRTMKQISFNVFGPTGTTGFCNVTIPKKLLSCDNPTEWSVKLDGEPLSFSPEENGTDTSLYFFYNHSIRNIKITGTRITLFGDLNGDEIVNIIDVVIVARAFGCKPGDDNWNLIADIDENGIINIWDVTKVAKEFGETA